MKLLLTKGVSDQTSTIIMVQAGNLSLSFFASFNILAEHISELFIECCCRKYAKRDFEVSVPGSFNPSTYL